MSQKRQPDTKIPREPAHLSAYFTSEMPCLITVTLSGIIYNAGLAVCPWLEGILVGILADILSQKKEYASVVLPFVIYILVVAIVQTSRAFKRLYVRKFANNTVLKFKTILYKTILRSKPGENIGAGDEITRAVGDAEICAEGMRKATTEVFDTGVVILSYAVLLFIYDPLLAPLALCFPPIAAFVAEKIKKPVTESAADCRKSAAQLSDATLDRVGNAVSYRINGLEKQQDEKYDLRLSDYEKKNIISGLFANGMFPVYNIISLVGVIFVIWLGGKNVLGSGRVQWDIAAFTAFLSSYVKLAVRASKTSKLFNSIQKADVSWKRIKPRLLSYDAEIDKAPAAPADVKAENLTLSFGKDAKIFENVSFEARPGQIIGITGEVASGKSMLGKAFLGEFSYEGRILFGNTELSEFLKDETRRYVSYVGHSPELFDGTIRDNILLGSKDDAEKYAKLCCIYDEFSEFENGLDTRIGEKGVRLSGGQQARTALARTLAHPAPIYILDDPFSAVDMNTEQRIFENLKEYCKDSVVLLISHRLSLFDQTDGVIFMKDGHAEFMSHKEMLETEPDYSRLYSAQSKGVTEQ